MIPQLSSLVHRLELNCTSLYRLWINDYYYVAITYHRDVGIFMNVGRPRFLAIRTIRHVVIIGAKFLSKQIFWKFFKLWETTFCHSEYVHIFKKLTTSCSILSVPWGKLGENLFFGGNMYGAAVPNMNNLTGSTSIMHTFLNYETINMTEYLPDAYLT